MKKSGRVATITSWLYRIWSMQQAGSLLRPSGDSCSRGGSEVFHCPSIHITLEGLCVPSPGALPSHGAILYVLHTTYPEIRESSTWARRPAAGGMPLKNKLAHFDQTKELESSLRSICRQRNTNSVICNDRRSSHEAAQPSIKNVYRPEYTFSSLIHPAPMSS